DEKHNQERWPSSNLKDFAWEYDATNRFAVEIENYSDVQRRWADSDPSPTKFTIEAWLKRALRAVSLHLLSARLGTFWLLHDGRMAGRPTKSGTQTHLASATLSYSRQMAAPSSSSPSAPPEQGRLAEVRRCIVNDVLRSAVPVAAGLPQRRSTYSTTKN